VLIGAADVGGDDVQDGTVRLIFFPAGFSSLG
jgi:hypothetical protein